MKINKNKINNKFKNKLAENKLNNFTFDNYSHLLFRLAFCSSYDLQKWFIQQECAFWRIKYCKSNKKSKYKFLHNVSIANNDMNYKNYKQYNYNDLKQQNLTHKSPINLTPFNATEKWVPYHCVSFVDAMYLISTRRVYIQNGYAFVPNYLFYLVVEEKYRKFLKNKLQKIKAMNLLTDTFLEKHPKMKYEINKIKHIFNGYVLQKISRGKYLGIGESFIFKVKQSHKIVYDTIGLKYFKYFPFCMKLIYNELMTKKHIKNGGRLQLSLFLKGIGLSKNEALKFWIKYDKNANYNYDVKYRYQQRDYSAHSCPTIIKTHTNIGDCNGCPFKRFENDNNGILVKLIKIFYNELNINYIKENILQMDRNRNDMNDRNEWKYKDNKYNKYTNQCKRLFEATYLNNNDNGIDIEDIESKWVFPAEYFKMINTLKNDRKQFENKFIKKQKKK
eukprot:208794_1